MSNYSVEVRLSIKNSESQSVLLNLDCEWPTNDYLSCVLLQEAIISGILEKTVEAGKAKFGAMNAVAVLPAKKTDG